MSRAKVIKQKMEKHYRENPEFKDAVDLLMPTELFQYRVKRLGQRIINQVLQKMQDDKKARKA